MQPYSLKLILSSEPSSSRHSFYGYEDHFSNLNISIPELRRMLLLKQDGGLLDLPPDILLLIFESLATFSDVQALVLTNRVFYNIWRTHSWTIYANLLPQLILCYPEAKQLAACQEHEIGEMAKKYQCDRRKCHSKIMCSNARIVGAAQGLFMSTRGSSLPYISKTVMEPSESARFFQAFYNFWAFNLADKFQWPNVLREMSLHQFYPLYELGFWIDRMKKEEQAALNGLFTSSTPPDWDTSWCVIDMYWTNVLNSSLHLGQTILVEPTSPRSVQGWSCFFDREQRYFMGLPFNKSREMLARFSRARQDTSDTTSSSVGIQAHPY